MYKIFSLHHEPVQLERHLSFSPFLVECCGDVYLIAFDHASMKQWKTRHFLKLSAFSFLDSQHYVCAVVLALLN